MLQRISLKLSNENDWLIEAIEQERKKQNRPVSLWDSFNFFLESDMDYFES